MELKPANPDLLTLLTAAVSVPLVGQPRPGTATFGDLLAGVLAQSQHQSSTTGEITIEAGSVTAPPIELIGSRTPGEGIPPGQGLLLGRFDEEPQSARSPVVQPPAELPSPSSSGQELAQPVLPTPGVNASDTTELEPRTPRPTRNFTTTAEAPLPTPVSEPSSAPTTPAVPIPPTVEGKTVLPEVAPVPTAPAPAPVAERTTAPENGPLPRPTPSEVAPPTPKPVEAADPARLPAAPPTGQPVEEQAHDRPVAHVDTSVPTRVEQPAAPESSQLTSQPVSAPRPPHPITPPVIREARPENPPVAPAVTGDQPVEFTASPMPTDRRVEAFEATVASRPSDNAPTALPADVRLPAEQPAVDRGRPSEVAVRQPLPGPAALEAPVLSHPKGEVVPHQEPTASLPQKIEPAPPRTSPTPTPVAAPEPPSQEAPRVIREVASTPDRVILPAEVKVERVATAAPSTQQVPSGQSVPEVPTPGQSQPVKTVLPSHASAAPEPVSDAPTGRVVTPTSQPLVIPPSVAVPSRPVRTEARGTASEAPAQESIPRPAVVRPVVPEVVPATPIARPIEHQAVQPRLTATELFGLTVGPLSTPTHRETSALGVARPAESEADLEPSRAVTTPAKAPAIIPVRPVLTVPANAVADPVREVPTIQWTELPEQIAEKWQGVARSSVGTELRLRIDQPDLGQVRIHLRSEGGSLTAVVVVASGMARDVAQLRLPELTERLRSGGISVKALSVITDRANGIVPIQPRRGGGHGGRIDLTA